MKIHLLFTFLFLIYLPSALHSQTEWVKTFGNRNYNNSSGPYTQVDKEGNIYIAGKNELISFDNDISSISGCYLAKLDSLGRLIWQQQLGDFLLNNQITGLAINESGDAFVAMNAKEATTLFGQVPITNFGGSALARYSRDGQRMWAKQLSVSFDFTRFMGIDNQSDIYFSLSKVTNNRPQNEYYLLKISGSNGTELYNRTFIQYESSFDTQLYSWVTDKFGNTYIGGNCKSESLLVGGQSRPIVNGAFYLKIDANGEIVWFKNIPHRGDESISDWRGGSINSLIISDDATRLYTLGVTARNTKFNSAGLTNGDKSSFFGKINANSGDFEWVNTVAVTISNEKILSEGNNTWLYATKSSIHSDFTEITLEGGKQVTIEPFASGNGAISTNNRHFIIPINDATGELRPLSILCDEGNFSNIIINQNRVIGVNDNLGKIYGKDSLYQPNTSKMFSIFSLPKSLLTYLPVLNLDSLTAQGTCENSFIKINARAQNMRLGNGFRLYTDHVGQNYNSYFKLNEGRQIDTTRYRYLDILPLHHAYKLHSKMRLCSSSPTWCSEPLDLTQPTILLNDTTLCYGNTLEVKSDIGLSYQWTPTRLFPNPNAQSNIIKPDTVVLIKLLSKTNLGCSRSDSVKITTIRPFFDIPDSVRLGCNDFDDHITLDARSKGGFHYALNYSWVNPISDLSFESIDNLGAIKDVYPSKSGQYKVVVKDDFFKCSFTDSTYCTVEPCKILKGQSTSPLINIEVYQKTPQDSVDWRLVKRTKGTSYGYYQVRLPMRDSAKFRFISDPSLWSSPSQTNFPMFYDSTFFISQSQTVKFSNLDTLTLNGNRWRLATNYKSSTVSGYVFDYYNPSTPIKNYELFLVDSNLYAKRRLTGTYPNDARIAYDKTDSTGRFSIKINEDPSVTYQFYGNRMDTRIDTLIAPKLVIPSQLNIKNIILYKKDSLLIACDNCAQLVGNIFSDTNSNCIRDSTDKAASNAIVQINPGNILVSASDTGQFNIYLKSGNYTLTTISPQYYTESCSTNGTNTLNFTLNSDTISKNIGFRPIPNIADIAVELTPETAFRPGFETTMQIDVSNKGTTPIPVILKFNYTDTVEMLGTNPLYSSNDNRQLTWIIPTLNVGEIKKFTVLMRFKPDVSFLGKKASFSSQVVVNNNLIDANLSDNTDTVSQIIRGSYDPNDKQVTPRGSNLGNQVLPSVNEYEFLIRFQNTGTDTAFTVVVRDTLTSEWDVASLKTISSSHAYKFALEKNNIAIWTFKNILLPDSTTNEIQSHGFVKFILKTRTTPLNVGTVLTNKAGIYFDFNPPIITNQVRINVVDKLVSTVHEIVSLAKVYPNPASDNLIIDLIGNSQPTRLMVSNILGQVIKTEQFEDKNHTLNVQSLENGVYLLSIRQGERIQNINFVIQR